MSSLLRRYGHNPEDPGSFFEALADGSEGETAAFEDYIDDIALGLAALCLAFDPEGVAVSGIVARAGEGALRMLEESLHRQAHLVTPRVVPSVLGDGAMLTGALEYALADVRVRWLTAPD